MNKLGRIRPDGKAVVFSSLASNLVTGDTNGPRDVFIRDLVANTTKRISLTGTGGQVHDAYPQEDRLVPQRMRHRSVQLRDGIPHAMVGGHGQVRRRRG